MKNAGNPAKLSVGAIFMQIYAEEQGGGHFYCHDSWAGNLGS